MCGLYDALVVSLQKYDIDILVLFKLTDTMINGEFTSSRSFSVKPQMAETQFYYMNKGYTTQKS